VKPRTAALLLAALSPSFLPAQQTVVTHQKQVKLHHLVGTVVDPKGFPVEYAVVDLCDPSDHHVLASTFADAQGRFSFADQKRGRQFEIRASHAGFNIAQYEIVVTELGQSKIRIILPVPA